jgi:hypothetical protein
MGSSGVAVGGNGQRNNAIDCPKLKRGGLIRGGGGLAWISRLARDDGKRDGR